MIAERFRERFGAVPQVLASAPGRVNLIGEHTDYNDGFVLPMAIGRRVRVAAAPRADNRMVAVSEEHHEEREILVSSESLAHRAGDWTAYVAAVASALTQDVRRTAGWNLVISGGVPVGAGLSSSAALELAVVRALCAVSEIPWDARAMARLTQRAENDLVGVRCGIMDQMAASAGRRGHAMLLDCRTLDLSYVPVPPDVAVVVMDTGVRRRLSGTEYNDRRQACERAVERIRAIAPGVRALRDVTPELLRKAEASLDPVVLRRARHVVEENRRPADMARALGARDFAAAGALMNESHASLRDLYEVSSVHLDLICEVARFHAACFGARMTGAGFGGCAIALVRSAGVDDFIRHVQPQYEARTYKGSDFFVADADEGARLDPL